MALRRRRGDRLAHLRVDVIGWSAAGNARRSPSDAPAGSGASALVTSG